MRYQSMRRLAGAGIVVAGLTIGVLASPVSSGASVVSKAGSVLTDAEGPGAQPTTVLPFYTGGTCETSNIDYWQLMYRPGYWYGLGNSIAEDANLSPLNNPVWGTDGSGNTTATISSKGWDWTNGKGGTEVLGAQDIVFWLNMDKAQSKQGAAAACGYVPHFGIPDQVANVTVDNSLTVTIDFTAVIAHGWLLYNELSQIIPMPTAWDTSNGTNNAGCSTESWASVATDGSDACSAVFAYLSGRAMNDPIWSWVDGPYRQTKAEITSGSPDGNDVMSVNAGYSDKAHDGVHAAQTIKFVPITLTGGEPAEQQLLGKGDLDLGYLDGTDVTAAPKPGGAGKITLKGGHFGDYDTVGGVLWGVFYWEFNFDTQYSDYHTSGKVPLWADELNQQYFRGAMQQAMDQAYLIAHTQNGYAVPTYSAIPAYPANSFKNGITNPYAYNTTKAKALMTKNGWSGKSAPYTCEKSGAAGCGTVAYPIPKGSKASVTLLYPGGDPATTKEETDAAAEMALAGIKVTLIARSANSVAGTCFYGEGKTIWQVCGYGGWLYDPDFYPSGEVLFGVGSSSNVGGYDSAEMTCLVQATTNGGSYALNQKDPSCAHQSFGQWTAIDLPFLWTPTPTTFSVQLNTVKGAEPPNPIGNFNPEFITAI